MSMFTNDREPYILSMLSHMYNLSIKIYFNCGKLSLVFTSDANTSARPNTNASNRDDQSESKI